MPLGPAVSVIVPARDAAGTIAPLLDALAAQTVGDLQVIVVDDASKDGTAAVVVRHSPATVVVTADGSGSYAARNRGLALASAPVVAFTDADCRPEARWLECALAALAPNTIVGGRVRQRHRDAATVWERYDRATYLDQGDLVRQGYAATANLVTHTATLRRLGGFDASLRSSGDLELGRRAGAAGVQVRYAADAVVEHQPRTGPGELWRLHRRLGSGWRDLARRGLAPAWWREPSLRVALGHVVEQVAADGTPLRRRQLAPVHLVAMSARWRGRLLG